MLPFLDMDMHYYRNFITHFKNDKDSIIVYYANKAINRIPNTPENEEYLLAKMEEQLIQNPEFNYDNFKASLIGIGLALPMSIASMVNLKYPTFTLFFLSALLVSLYSFLKNYEVYDDYQKNRYFRAHQEALKEILDNGDYVYLKPDLQAKLKALDEDLNFNNLINFSRRELDDILFGQNNKLCYQYIKRRYL